MSDAIRVGLIGLGAIGCRVQQLVDEHHNDTINIIGAVVRDPQRARTANSLPLLTTVAELMALKPDIVVEAAGHDALRQHGPEVLRAGCDLLFLGVGALANPQVETELLDAARAGGGRARVVSGAIGALDAISAAAIGELRSVTHTTRKPARTLLPHDEADKLTEATEIFRGSAREGALLFPESINVAAAVSLAGVGLDATEVRVLADPAISRNRHEVEVEGDFGWLKFEVQGIPSDENPRTGRLVAMSVVHQLLLLRAPLMIG